MYRRSFSTGRPFEKSIQGVGVRFGSLYEPLDFAQPLPDDGRCWSLQTTERCAQVGDLLLCFKQLMSHCLYLFVTGAGGFSIQPSVLIEFSDTAV